MAIGIAAGLLVFIQCASAQTNSWIGPSIGSWNTSTNWSLGVVPTSAHDVFLPDGSLTTTISVNTAAVCNTLTIEGGDQDFSLLITGSNSLTVTGEVNIYAGLESGSAGDDKIISVGTGTMTCGSVTMEGTGHDAIESKITISTGTVTVSGNITMNSPGPRNTITFSGAGQLFIGGDISGGNIIASTGTVHFNSSAPQGIPSYPYYNLTVSGAGAKSLSGHCVITGNLLVMASTSLSLDVFNLTVDAGVSRSVTIDGEFNINGDGRLLELQSGIKSLVLGPGAQCNITDSGGSTLPAYDVYDFDATSTVKYGATDAQTIENAATYGHLTVSGNATKTLEGSGGAITITGDMTIEGGTILASNDKSIHLEGHWTNHGSFTEGSSTVIFDGTILQLIGGASITSFNNVIVDNNGSGVFLATDATITATLTLTNGILQTGGYILEITQSAPGAIVGGSSSSFISGTFRQSIASGINTYLIPLGMGTSDYTPLELFFSAGTSAGVITCTTTGSDHPDIGNSTLYTEGSVNRYWTITTNSGLGTAFYDAVLHWSASDEDAGFDDLSSNVGKYSGGLWDYPTIGTRTTTSVEILGESGFSDFQVSSCITASISEQPASVTVCQGTDATLEVTATGPDLLFYQWYKTGTGPLSDGGNITGSTSSILVINPAELSDAGNYYVVVSRECGTAVLSTDAIVTVLNSVTYGSITGNDETLCVDEDPANITLSILPSGGAGGFAYQWYYQDGITDCPTGNNTTGWTLIESATNAGYDPPSGLSGSRTYALLVDATGTPDCAGPGWADACRQVTVNHVSSGMISSDQTVCFEGDPMAFAVEEEATGSGSLTYQWQYSTTDCNSSFTDVPGATDAVYDPQIGIVETTYFRRIVTSTLNGTACVAQSNCVLLTVLGNLHFGIIEIGDETICEDGDPGNIELSSVPIGGTGSFAYQWYYQDGIASCPTGSNTTGWTLITAATNETYDPPAGLNASRTYALQVDVLGNPDCAVPTWAESCRHTTVNHVQSGTITGDQIICPGGNPAPFTESEAASGSGLLTYQWQSSTTDCENDFTDIPGATVQTYDVPAGVTMTTYYRRITTSTLDEIECSALSNCVIITVNGVDAGSIGNDQTICIGGDPALLVTTFPASGSGALSYQWQSSTAGCGSGFANISGATNENYNPPAGFATTTYFRRVVTSVLESVSCNEISNCVVVTINNVTAGTIAADQTHCPGGDPEAFTVQNEATGSGVLSYQWQQSYSDCNTGFSNIEGATNDIYDPPSGIVGTIYYRRIVTSTLNEIQCSATSNCVTVTMNNVTAGTISSDQTVCAQSDPDGLTTVIAAIGSGVLSYQWQSSITDCDGIFTDIDGATDEAYDPPPGIEETTYYRRIATSTLNDVACSAMSNCITIVVNTVSSGSVNGDQTICSGGDAATITISVVASGSGTLSYQWQQSTSNCNNEFTDIPGATQDIFDPPAGLTQTTYYRRVVTSTLSGIPCEAITNCVTVSVNNVDGGLIDADQTICDGGDPSPFIIVAPPTGSGILTYQWQNSGDGCLGTFYDITGATDDTYDPPGGLLTAVSFRRVTISTLNGITCNALSNCLSVTVLDPVSAGILSAGNESICYETDPELIEFNVPPEGGTGSFTYQWYYQDGIVACPTGTATSGWTAISSATNMSYDPPPGLTISRTYAVQADANGSPDCNDATWSTGCRQVVVYGTIITSGPIEGPEVITQCSGGNPESFSADSPSGGDANYTFLWEQSEDCTGLWEDAIAEDGIIHTLSFDPPVLNLPPASICYRLKITDGCGHTGYSTVKTYNIVTDPVSPTINPIPDAGTTVCLGTVVSATFNAGSGGTGVITDEFEYSTDGALNWSAYTPGSPITATMSMIGENMIRIRSRRTATGIGCDDGIYEIVQWSVDHIAPDITTCPISRELTGCDIGIVEDPVYSENLVVSSYATFSNAVNQGSADDNCGITQVSYHDVSSGTCPIIVTRTWILKDEAGNITPCEQTITITVPEIMFTCAENQLLESCQTQEEIDEAFSLWLEATTAIGGCDGVLTHNATTAPAACGGSTDVTWTYTSSCAPFTTTCTKSFTVASAPEVVFNCALDQIEEVCQTQEAIDAAFALWLTTTTANGGCNGELTHNATAAPDACGGSTDVTWTYTSSCAPFITTCTRTFTVDSAPEVIFNCAADQTEAACQTQEEIDVAFILWLETATASGGCNSELTHNATTAPDACGGSTDVTWTYTSSCVPYTTTCTRTFTVQSVPVVLFTCAENQTEAGCQTQEAIDAAFALWLTTTTANGGCNGELTHNATFAPDACGGSTDVTWTYTSSCAPFITTCTRTFTVESAPAVVFSCATDQTEAACQTQEAIDAAFALWLETTAASGGCNGALSHNATVAPDACGGSTDVTWTYTSSCAPFTTTCTRTFTVESAPTVVFSCATDQMEAACQTQETIDAAFALWLETTAASGGCNGELTHNATTAPDACGGSTDVTWTYTSSCAPFITTCTKTFTVETTPEVIMSCTADQTEAACQTQEAIDAAFALWLETTTASGGCNGVLNHNATVAPDACGGSTDVTWTYTSSCAPFTTTCTRTFTVEGAPEIIFTCAADQTEAACQTQEAIDAAFALWLETTTATGGCNGALNHNAIVAPDACGGSTDVTWTYISSCAPFITTCTRTFTVEGAPEIIFACATDQTESACQTQEAIDAAFALWLETTIVSGGCNGNLSHNATAAPDACGGNADVTWTFTSSCAPFVTTCTRTFTVEGAPEIIFTCAADQTEAACQTQEAIDAAFALWLTTTMASGGCNGELTHNATTAPDACGGSTDVTWTYTSSCVPYTTTCTKTFTIESAPGVVFSCATDQTEAACQTQEAIDAAFTLWLSTTTASGGCNGELSHNATTAPDACGGSTDVTWTYTSSCVPYTTTCTRTFTVESAPEVVFSCATDQTEAACQTQEAIDVAFALWLETTVANGGCNGVLTHDATTAPDACGGSTDVTWTYTNSCAPLITTCTRTFTVESAPEVVFICGVDQIEAACQTQEAIDAAFALWLETTVANGGCNGVLTHDATTAPDVCGGSTDVTWTYTSSCAPFITTCTRTFTVESAPEVVFICGIDQTEAACQTQEAIDAAFALWLETTVANGGCDGILTHNAITAPDACGGSVDVTWTYTSSCAPFSTTCTKTFTVENVPEVVFICGADQIEAACQTQEAIDAAFALWLETTMASGGCNGDLIHDATLAPAACGGSTDVTWTYTSSCAPFVTTCTRTFTVESTPDVVFICGEDQIEGACQTQEAIDAAFALWLETTTASGGCNGDLIHNATIAPDACGGSTDITWTYTSSCAPFVTTCTRTFTVESAPEVVFICGEDQIEGACQTQEAINAAFTLWLETTTASGGCNGDLTHNATIAPDACGGSTDVTWTYTSSCTPFVTTCTRTFTVESAPEVVFICGANQIEGACQTQEAIDAAFALWLETTTASGGCNGDLTHNATVAPDICGGIAEVTWTYTNSCAPFVTTCTRTFTVESAPEVVFICGADQIEEACQTQGAIDSAFVIWLETTTASGGCNSNLTHNATAAPDACGGSVDVTWTYTSSCTPFTTACTRTFTVNTSEVDLMCAADHTETSCETQEEVDAAFELWLETTTASGGCDGSLSHNAANAPPACGGSVDVTWTYTSSCAPFVTQCTSTFTVDNAPEQVFTCAGDMTIPACETQEDIDTAFALWLSSTMAIGGCNGELTNNATTAPSICGGSRTVTWTYTSTCAPFITQCTRTFTVENAPSLIFSCGVHTTVPACQTQGAIDSAFGQWLETTTGSGGCNGVLINDATNAPSACGGSTIVTWVYESDCTPFNPECTRTFTVAPAPAVLFVCANDQVVAACQTQGAVDTAFGLWLDETSASGGCNGILTNNATSPPSACGGSTTVTWTYTTSCAPFVTTCTRTFTVLPQPEIMLSCPTDQVESACQTQGAIDTAFSLWLESGMASGGCNAELIHDDATAPDACGGSTEVTWTYISSCAPYITTCTRIFTVEGAPDIILTCAEDLTEAACQTQEAIDAAFALWLETTTAVGGCNGVLTHNANIAPDACGGSTEVTWTYTSTCAPYTTTCTRTFSVEAAQEVVFICVEYQTEAACQTQEEIDISFALWLESTTASGGCNGLLAHDATTAPDACGGSTDVTWTYTSSCAPYITTCTRTFTVESAPEVIFSCATDQMEAACQTQEEIDIAFALWLETTTASGGCNGELTNDATVAPNACGGSTNVTWTYTSSCMPYLTTCAKTFTVESAPEATLICASDQTEAACQSQEVIDATFALWLETTTASGGCNGALSHNATVAPSACGGSTEVTWTYISSCAPYITTCTKTFSVESIPEVVFTCATDQTEAACQTQEAIDAAFALWLETTIASGGCNGVLSHNANEAPDACGGSVDVTWTYTSSCAPYITTCTKTFSVESAPEVVFSCATDQTESACQSQEAIDAAFILWLEATSATGGCNGVLTHNATNAPNACGGSTEVTWTYTSSCTPFITTCTKTFTVESAPAIIFTCAIDQTEAACQSQEAIDAAFTLWLETTIASGGCNGVLSHNATEAPDACGGSVDVIWTYTSSCAPFMTSCTRTFTVENVSEVILSCASNQTEPACQTQVAIDAAFALWLETTTANGGCNGVLSHDALDAPDACGGSVDVTWTYTSTCAPFTTSCTRTFTVEDAPEVIFSCTEDQTEQSCQSQEAINAAFTVWLAETTASGGCNGVLTHNATVAPDVCGGSTEVTWTYTSSCAPFITTCTRTFTVESAAEVFITCADIQIEAACQTQEAINTAFTLWLETTTASGGCNGVLTHNAIAAPDACGGSVDVIWTYTSSCAPIMTTCTQTFTVLPAPEITLNCAIDQTEGSCQTQEAIDAAFILWLQTTTATGGCNSLLTHDATTAPSACGGNTTVTWTYESSCPEYLTTCSAIFTVLPAPEPELICPQDHLEPACQTQTAIDAAFSAWLASATGNGGCNATLSHDATTAPSACGGNTTITWTYESSCAPFITQCSRTFTVATHESLVITCPDDISLPACTAQGVIDMSFQQWIQSLEESVAGGCGLVISYFVNDVLIDLADLDAPDLCTGGSVTVEVNYSDMCESGSCISTFNVVQATGISVTCPEDITMDACSDQEMIDAAFASWIAALEEAISGGCALQITYVLNGDIVSDIYSLEPPSYCEGGLMTMVCMYSDLCMSGSCASTFVVPVNTPPTLSNTPVNQSYNTLPSGCQRTIPILKPGIEDDCDADPALTITCDDPNVIFFDFGSFWQGEFQVGVTTITITGSDACGNVVNHVFAMTINDIFIPTITGCPSGITRSTESGQCGAHVYWTAPTASDNCPGVTLVTSHTPGDFFPVGTTSVTYTATDIGGLINTCTFIVTVNDTAAPVFNCASLETISLTAFAYSCENDTDIPVPVASDNCDGLILATGLRSDGASLNDPWEAETTTTITWSFTDEAGNTATCTQLVIVDACQWPSVYVYVDATKTSGGQTGFDWENALLRVEEALQLSVTYPNIEEIWVAGGRYYPTEGTSRTSTFTLTSNIKVLGGFEGIAEDLSDRNLEANPTFLDGNIGNPQLNSDNCYHVVTVSSSVTNAIVDGFIIINGNANGTMGFQNVGGGLFIQGDVQLINADIISNNASSTGSAIYTTSTNGNLMVRDCSIMNNTSGNGRHVVIMNNAHLMLQGMNQIEN